MNYGLPYMGSKNDLAARIVAIMPRGGTLVDLFAGGGAVTHAALLSRKWKKVVMNDITDAVELFRKAVEGRVENLDRWVSREEFHMRKDADPFVRIVWSFGNGQKEYIYSRNMEPYKKAMHDVVFGGGIRQRYFALKRMIRVLLTILKKDVEMKKRYDELEGLERLERLQGLEGLERLERLQGLDISQADYKDVPIPDDAVIYCDPPYAGTAEYTVKFDHEAFYDWCRRQTRPLFISEYNMPQDFPCVAEWRRVGSLSAVTTNETTERLYALNWEPPRGMNMKQMELFRDETTN